MVKRLYMLSKMEFSSLFNKIKSHFATKITTFLSSSVVFFLFVHIFRDFKEKHLKLISLEISDFFGTFFALFLLLIGGSLCSKSLRSFLFSQKRSLNFARTLGEEDTVLKFHTIFHTFLLIFSVYLPFFLLSFYFFASWRGLELIFYFTFPLVFCFFYYFFLKRSSYQLGERRISSLADKALTQQEALYKWRSERLLGDPLMKALFILSTFLTILGTYLFSVREFRLLSVCLYFCSGFTLGVAVLYCVSEDFKSIWLERLSGVSHDSYMKSVLYLAKIIAFFIVIFHIASLVLNLLFWQVTLDQSLSLLVFQCLVIQISPIFLVNIMALQVDPRKLLTQVILLFMIGLFFCSAVLIHPLAFLFWPVLYSYGKKSQQDRFYTI